MQCLTQSRLRLATMFGIASAMSLTLVGEAAPPTGKAAPKRGVSPASAPATPLDDNTPLTEEQRIVHALNRLGFGPRPGDVERVRAIGLNRYLAEQLNPERIPDDAVEAKVASLDLLRQSNE